MKPKKKTPEQLASDSQKGKKAKGTCFVIMPMGDWYDDYYSYIYCPAIRAAGLDPYRADDLYRPSAIINDIWKYTRASEIVLADLTGRNANVFYELGLAHAIGRPAVLVAPSMDEVPFDLRNLRIILYDKNDASWGAALRAEIKASLLEVRLSPASSVLPTFLKVEKTKPGVTVTQHQKDMLQLRQEVALLRREVRRPRESEGSTLLGPEEARVRLLRYVDMGLPDREIFARMSSLGAPAEWTKEKLTEVRRSRRRPSAQREKSVEYPMLSRTSS